MRYTSITYISLDLFILLLFRIQSSLSNRSNEDDDSASVYSMAATTIHILSKDKATPTPAQPQKKDTGPSLEDFDHEIEVYKNSQDELINAPLTKDVGWVSVNMQVQCYDINPPPSHKQFC